MVISTYFILRLRHFIAHILTPSTGVVKTHRLLLMNAPALMVPTAPYAVGESKLSISARALRDLLDHFPIAKGPKSDPQLVWSFSSDELILKGLESSLDTSGNLFLCSMVAPNAHGRCQSRANSRPNFPSAPQSSKCTMYTNLLSLSPSISANFWWVFDRRPNLLLTRHRPQ